jgi:hypothetical protein
MSEEDPVIALTSTETVPPTLARRSPTPHPELGLLGIPEGKLKAFPLDLTAGANGPCLIR